MSHPEAIVIGSGPNGLAAGIRLAQQGIQTQIWEQADTVGGGMRTKYLTLPGFRHDVCSAVHPMGLLSPFFSSLPLASHGLEWVHPEILLAHPLAQGRAAVMHKSIAQTAAALPHRDRHSYEATYMRLTNVLPKLLPNLLGPPLRLPRHPFSMAFFGLQALMSAKSSARQRFLTEEGQALFAGIAAHSVLPLENMMTSAIGIMLATAGHLVGWPVALGGSQSIADALASYFRSLGGEILTNHPVTSLKDLPPAKAYLFDTAPKQLADICGEALPASYAGKLRKFQHGPGAFKLDLALSGPIPWTNEDCRKAGTVHVGGALEEICESERLMFHGQLSERPYVLVSQQSVYDTTRAPAGKHTCWAYAHVPTGFTGDASTAILNQIERFAPGFQDTILAKHTMSPKDFQAYNPSYIGGDIIGGITNFKQILARPTFKITPYATPAPNIFICSASTPPGGGVHGMCGFHAAETALKNAFGLVSRL